jgi:hypothetical protein
MALKLPPHLMAQHLFNHTWLALENPLSIQAFSVVLPRLTPG